MSPSDTHNWTFLNIKKQGQNILYIRLWSGMTSETFWLCLSLHKTWKYGLRVKIWIIVKIVYHLKKNIISMSQRFHVCHLSMKNKNSYGFWVEIQTVFKTTDHLERKKWVLTIALLPQGGVKQRYTVFLPNNGSFMIII